MKKKKILIIGRHSFIAFTLYNNLKIKYDIKKLSFEKFKKTKLKKLNKFNYVINCSLKRNYISKKYNYKNDLDLLIVKKIKKTNIKYILLSSRKVYYPKANIKESDKINPISKYGENKSITERKITRILKNKLLILRISNIIGAKPKKELRKIHKTFLDFFFENISNGYILNNKTIFKDFLTTKQLTEIIHKLIKSGADGIYNVSMGKRVLLSSLVKWLLKYNNGRIKSINLTTIEKKKLENKSFYLNNDKLKRKINLNFNLDELKKECFKLSKKYFYEKK